MLLELLLDEKRRLFRVENDVRQFFSRQQIKRIAERERIDRRTVEVGARGYAARAGRRQHGNVFGDRKLRRKPLAVEFLARAHVEHEVRKDGAARIKESAR